MKNPTEQEDQIIHVDMCSREAKYAFVLRPLSINRLLPLIPLFPVFCCLSPLVDGLFYNTFFRPGIYSKSEPDPAGGGCVWMIN